MSERRRVLVIEDDEGIRELVELALSEEDYEVWLMPDGATALASLGEIRPDVILLDMKMPVMDGWEFARRYHALADRSAPLLVFSAAQDAAQRAAEIGADGYIPKPFDIDELLAAVASATTCGVAGQPSAHH